MNQEGDIAVTTKFAKNLEKYAEVVVKVGLNIQPGQRLLIGSPCFDGLTPLVAAPLVRLIAAIAYRKGARLVDVMWDDDQLKTVRLQHTNRETLTEFPRWQVETAADYITRGDATLIIFAHNPQLLINQDQEAVSILDQVRSRSTAPILNYISRNTSNWSAVPVPIPGWTETVFPGLSYAQGEEKLWDAIFRISRVYEADPVSVWQKHVELLAKRSDYLNEKQYRVLKFKGSGTDLTVGLPSGHIWRSARMTSKNGIPFTANIPTEEVFTMPHKDKVDGYVTLTKPLSFAGSLMDNIKMTISKGKVVAIQAEKGKETLEKIAATDEGASRLGEVALVPHSSPVSRSGLLFYNILIDENASSHLALGNAYRFTMEKGATMTEEEWAATGGNQSTIHLDFMIGSGDIDVDGIKTDGDTEPVMRKGEWAFGI